MNLFLDSASSKICIVLFNESGFLVTSTVMNNYQHVEQLVNTLFDFLTKHSVNHYDLNKIYFTNGPSKYIGTKVALIVIKILVLYNPTAKLFVANSLNFAKGFSKNSCSSLTISKNNNYVCNSDGLISIERNNDKLINHDYYFIDSLLNNFPKLSSHFSLTNEITVASFDLL